MAPTEDCHSVSRAAVVVLRPKRRLRRITQKELAKRIQSTQPRIARLEQTDASIEMLIRALFALGSDRKEIGKLLAA